MSSRSVYTGTQRKLVLAFDVGTTFSGISYSVLDPGQVPEIKGVTRFPAHEQINGASKIPTVIYYDRSGNVKAVGAEAMAEGMHEQAVDEQWVKAEWFKLHLRSRIGPGAGKEVAADIPPLPLNKTVVEVISDFLAYLFKCTASYIQDADPNGVSLWASLRGQINFVLSHPNGWEGTQQSQMRKAVVLAGLIPDTPNGHARLSFVTEGEASLHFAIQHGLPASAVNKGEGVVIVDAGGGTIDISSYSKNISSPKQAFEEIAIPQCHFHGSVFVTTFAERFLLNFLEDSPFVDDLRHIVQCFDKTTKLRFRNADTPQYVKFGSTRDNDANHNIRFGQLKLLGTDIASFFQLSVDCIVDAVLDQKENAHKPISHVILVGGFASSDYLLNQIHDVLIAAGLNVHRPDTHVNKAVSDGALSFYLDHVVRTRISKVTYGTLCAMQYEFSDPDHFRRRENLIMSRSGVKLVDGIFSRILPKNTQVSETKEFRSAYFTDYESPEAMQEDNIKHDIVCYRGNILEPKWKDIDPENYTNLCTINVEPGIIPLKRMVKPNGPGCFYRLDYDYILIFGLTELKAQVAWKEGGIEKRSEAKIVYEPDISDDRD
ncbi:hypothetical protein BDN70DRAFT_933388 [Pholiota conissans]|uniref:Uncharacterized protein n=1 Tax=Pholiota conissans TaxID=109636 RepID=A0A9P5Z081_9AGAR|nr:hypothetical protein BDN70DRAFT_933388 [Pholiota conissans]